MGLGLPDQRPGRDHRADRRDRAAAGVPVGGANALGSGVRLLPLVGGMLAGMVGGTRLTAPRRARDGGSPARPAVTGPRTIVTVGYLLMAAAMGLGALTTLGSSTGYTLAWVAVAGLGLGLVMPAAMGIALGCALLAVVFLRRRPVAGDAADTASSEPGSLSVM